MTTERRYFGTDGIRGVANQSPLEPESLVRLGKAIARVFLERRGRQKILIGKDTRLSGYMIENSLAAGITCLGADVLLVGPVPTPGLAYLTWSMRASAGIMISASHNPYQDNGIKIFGADGYKLPDEIESRLEELMAPGVLDSVHAASTDIGKASRVNDAIGRYTVFLKNTFPRELTLEGLKIGLDCANGASYIAAPQTFIELGADVVSRGVSPNGRNINAGFGSLHPETLRKVVLDQGLDIGICLDGDADRAIFIDDKGRIMDGDMALAICALDMKDRGVLKLPTAVVTVMSNLGLEKLLQRKGIQLERVQVGDRYVLERMLQIGAQIGGEQSGHMIFKDMATSGDGTLTALMVLAAMCRTGKKLSELNSEFVQYPQKMVNIPVSSKPPLESLPAYQKAFTSMLADLKDTGRILVRYSGTENKVRVMAECADIKMCDAIVDELSAILKREIGAPEK